MVSAWINALCSSAEGSLASGTQVLTPRVAARALTRFIYTSRCRQWQEHRLATESQQEHLTCGAPGMTRSSQYASRYGHLQGKTKKNPENKQNPEGFLTDTHLRNMTLEKQPALNKSGCRRTQTEVNCLKVQVSISHIFLCLMGKEVIVSTNTA